jgi:hypothetical protein
MIPKPIFDSPTIATPTPQLATTNSTQPSSNINRTGPPREARQRSANATPSAMDSLSSYSSMDDDSTYQPSRFSSGKLMK